MKKILFVDDEPAILEGIERSLFHLADSWEIMTAESGPEALEELAEEPYDVIVTDMRMPGMDGAALLLEVSKRFPSVVRIVLSGHAELQAAMRAVPVAHQFLSKPCQAGRLETVVERACALQRLLADEAVRSVVGRIRSLPSVPAVYRELTVALANEATEVSHVAEIVSKDPAMSAKVLQLVNSAFFGRAMAIHDVRQAVVRLGFQMIRSLALSAEVFRMDGAKRSKGLRIDEVQKRSMRVAGLAHSIPATREQRDDAYSAGMLHDVGMLVLAAELPDEYTEVQRRAAEPGADLCDIERELLGVTHEHVGAYLLGMWGLPYPIVEAVAFHHGAGAVTHTDGLGVLEAVHIAQCLEAGALPDGGWLEVIGVNSAQLDSWRSVLVESEREQELRHAM